MNYLSFGICFPKVRNHAVLDIMVLCVYTQSNVKKSIYKKKIYIRARTLGQGLFFCLQATVLIFSKNRPLADSFIESRCPSARVRVYPFFHAIFFEASHWPSDHMTRSRPLIGQPSFPTLWWWWGEGT